MLELEIDGKPVQVDDGSTVMDAAKKLGIYIPHFCYHKKLSIAANCRMCLVQVEKAPKPLPACATPATNGMKVYTHSPAAVKAQKGVMEFLLINHPLDCPICDQGGECQLQDLAVGYGQAASRYQEEKRVVHEKDLGPLVQTFMTRCINCTRCVRFLDEIGGYQEMGQAFRGERAEIMPFLGRTIDSELSGNIIDLCPVGALTSKPFLYRARTWELTRRRSVSPHDGFGSNLIVQSRHDVVKRVLPLDTEAINECWLSDRDRFAYPGLEAADRLTTPLVKRDGQWVEVDWATALEVAVNRIKSVIDEEGAQQAAFLAHPMATVEELHLLKRLGEALGVGLVDARPERLDARADAARGAAAWLGMDYAGIAALDRLLVIGAALRQELPLLAHRVRQAAKRGLKVAALDFVADDWRLPVAPRLVAKPSEFVARLAAVVRAAAEEKGVPVPAVAQEAAAPDETERALARQLRSGERRAIWLGALALAHPDAAAIEALASELAQLTGATLGWLPAGANAVGAQLVGALGAETALASLAQPRAAYLLLHLEPEDFADQTAARTAFERARTVVALTAYAGEALRACADVLLPVAPFTETSGTFVNLAGMAQSFTAVVRPKGETRPGWKVLRAIGAMLGFGGFAQQSSEEVRAEALPEGWQARLARSGASGFTAAARPSGAGLERIPLAHPYARDPIVRRSPPLQQTAEAQRLRLARIHPDTARALKVNNGDRIALGDGCVAEAALDGSVPPGAVLLALDGVFAQAGRPWAVLSVERA
ncbi:MAG: NADH-quinone oxidoreductase subunit G [Rhodocyclales bacterium]|nr:NADH-quinone oxidoreductase subunit G [Rhodocyclales bacterium]